MLKRLTAEFIGTLWLVLGGCGAAVISAAFPNVGIDLLGVALAFGLTVLTMAYAIGHISGCHLNPAVSVGLCARQQASIKLSIEIDSSRSINERHSLPGLAAESTLMPPRDDTGGMFQPRKTSTWMPACSPNLSSVVPQL